LEPEISDFLPLLGDLAPKGSWQTKEAILETIVNALVIASVKIAVFNFFGLL
jgi:hypothetical protein